MKKLLVAVAIVLLLCPLAQAIEWEHVNQFTASWDPVTTDIDGDPLPSDATIKYRFWMANAVTDPQKNNPVQVSEETAPTVETTVTVGTKGQYYVGVSAVMVFVDGTEMESDINWADEAADQGTTTLWAIRHHAPPIKPQNLTRP